MGDIPNKYNSNTIRNKKTARQKSSKPYSTLKPSVGHNLRILDDLVAYMCQMYFSFTTYKYDIHLYCKPRYMIYTKALNNIREEKNTESSERSIK